MIAGQLDIGQVIDLQEGRVPEDLQHRVVPPCSSSPLRGPGAKCDWCPNVIPEFSETGRRTRSDAETCGVVCRKRRHRFGSAVRDVPERSLLSAGGGMCFSYADPPYPGKAGYYVENREVDHAELIGRLVADYRDGWALSTSSGALQAVLAYCPPDVRVCVWRRQVRPTRSRRALSAWEPLIVWNGRPLPTDRTQELIDVHSTSDVILDAREFADWLDYRGRYDSFPGALIGMKPPEFAVWMFGQLGAGPRDALHDLYPGSGAIGRAWELYRLELSRTSTNDDGDPRDASLGTAARRAA